MILIQMIPLDQVKMKLEDMQSKYPQFTMVFSKGYLKIYKQIR